MKKYLGVKIVDAEPMCEFDFLKFSDKGKAIVSSEYINREGYKVVYEDGYTSWSPKEVFEKAYRPITGLTFGLAIEALKQGKKVVRAAWNDRGYLILYNKENIPEHLDRIEFRNIILFESPNCHTQFPHNVEGKKDMLAEDWMIIE